MLHMTNDDLGKAANAVFSYLENLEQNISPNYALSDTLFLSVTRRGLGVHRKPIEIDHTQYHILDASSNKWQHCFNEADVVVFVVSLTSYCEFPYGDTQTVRGTLALVLVENGRMTDVRTHRIT